MTNNVDLFQTYRVFGQFHLIRMLELMYSFPYTYNDSCFKGEFYK